MSTGSELPARGPDVELEYLFDDVGTPSEVTIFTPEEGRRTTEWLTAAAETAVPFEEMC